MPNGEGTSGGYDCEFTQPPPAVYQTTCPICHLILRDPYQATCCGYNFCYTCSQQVQRNNSPCPWCRKAKYEFQKDMGMGLALNKLGVYCTYSIDGCTWRGELRELQAHLDNSDHSRESLQYEHASRYTVMIYSLLGACRAFLRRVWVSCICWSNQWLVASITLLWEEVGVQWLWHRHRKSQTTDCHAVTSIALAIE